MTMAIFRYVSTKCKWHLFKSQLVFLTDSEAYQYFCCISRTGTPYWWKLKIFQVFKFTYDSPLWRQWCNKMKLQSNNIIATKSQMKRESPLLVLQEQLHPFCFGQLVPTISLFLFQTINNIRQEQEYKKHCK